MRGRLRAGGQSVSFFAFQDIITSVIGVLLFISLLLSLFIGVESGERRSSEIRSAASASEILKLDQLLEQVRILKAKLSKGASQADGDAAREGKMLQNELDVLNSQLATLQSTAKPPSGQGAEVREQVDVLTSSLELDNEKLAVLQKDADQIAKQLAALVEKREAIEAEVLVEEQRKNDIWLIPERADTSKRPIIVVANKEEFIVKTLDSDWRETFDAKGKDLGDMLKAFDPTDYYVVMYFRPSTFHTFTRGAEIVRSMKFDLGYDPISEDQNISFRSKSP